jgi:hypothetical protein
MTNLTDLLPAGAGGKQVSFTADGSISQGDTVALQTNGTVKSVGLPAAVLDAVEGEFNDASSSGVNTSSSTSLRALYNPDEDRVYFFWGVGSTIYYSSGTYDGTSWTFATPTSSGKTASSNQNGLGLDVVYDTSQNKGIIVWEDGTGAAFRSARVALLTFSGTTVSWLSNGTQIDYNSLFPSVATDNNGTFLVVYENYPNNQANLYKGVISGTSFSLYGPNLINSNGGYWTQYPVIYVPEKQRYLALTTNSSGGLLCNVIEDTGGTTIPTVHSNNSISNLASGGNEYKDLCWDAESERVLVFGKNSSPYPCVQSCTFTATSNNVSQSGSVVVLKSAALANQTYALKAEYNRDGKQTFVSMSFSSTSTPSQYVVLSGTTPTIDVSATNLYSDTTNSFQDLTSGATGTARVYIGLYASQTSGNFTVNDGYAQTYTMPLSNYTDFIGIADAAISDTASGNITIKGGVASNGLSSLTPGSTYYVQENGTLSTTSSSVTAGKALSATSINLDYSS